MTSMDVVVVGSCMTDLVSYVPRLPKPGETLQGHKFSKGFGGKGANQCVMAARMGANTAMVAKLGDDTFGHDTIKNFENNNINIDHVHIVSGEMSGVAPITVDDKGENAIVIIPGANSKLTTDDVLNAKDVIVNAKVLVCQLEVPNETTLAALKLAKENNVTTLFNAAPGQSGLSEDLFMHTDILCVNETEAELITGVSVIDEASAANAVKVMKSKCKTVVLTMGGAGVLFHAGDGKPTMIQAESVTVVDTTGAGDAFVGSLAYYLSRHSSLAFEEMVRRSTVGASHTVTMKGTQSSYIVDDLPKELFTI